MLHITTLSVTYRTICCIMSVIIITMIIIHTKKDVLLKSIKYNQNINLSDRVLIYNVKPYMKEKHKQHKASELQLQLRSKQTKVRCKGNVYPGTKKKKKIKIKGRKENSVFLHPDSPENNNVLVFQIQVAIEDCNDFSLKSNAGKPLQRLQAPTVQKHCVTAHGCNGDRQKKHFKREGVGKLLVMYFPRKPSCRWQKKGGIRGWDVGWSGKWLSHFFP